MKYKLWKQFGGLPQWRRGWVLREMRCGPGEDMALILTKTTTLVSLSTGLYEAPTMSQAVAGALYAVFADAPLPAISDEVAP